MLPPTATRAKARISAQVDLAKVVALVSDPRSRFTGSGTRRTLAPWYAAALASMSDGDLAVLEVLSAHAVVGRQRAALRVASQRLHRRAVTKRASRLAGDQRANYDATMRSLAEQVGRTKPMDVLTPLCADLNQAGLGATQIALLLHALHLERLGDPEEGRRRIQERLRRARRRA